MIERALTEVYLTTARRPISAVVRRVLEDLERHNARTTAAQALPVPKPGTLARAIARRIAQLDPYEVDRARWGRRIADQRHRSTSRQRLATRILERVEIDHSPLKIVVGTEAGPLGQPWLTVLIDYYSRLIVGFCLGFEPPSYAVIMEALRQAILPKSYVRERYPQIANAWPCFGVPEKLVCDRGSDLTSKDLEQAAFQLGMELDFMPPRTPHLKGTVESFFDTLNDQLLSTLPGRTFRSWEKRADYNADDGPLLPYEALVEIIHRHLIDVYAQEKHPTAAKTRLEMWQESAAEFPPALPASPDELVVLLSKSTERSLSVRGIELAGMFYLSDELAALRAELAANNLLGRPAHGPLQPLGLGVDLDPESRLADLSQGDGRRSVGSRSDRLSMARSAPRGPRAIRCTGSCAVAGRGPQRHSGRRRRGGSKAVPSATRPGGPLQRRVSRDPGRRAALRRIGSSTPANEALPTTRPFDDRSEPPASRSKRHRLSIRLRSTSTTGTLSLIRTPLILQGEPSHDLFHRTAAAEDRTKWRSVPIAERIALAQKLIVLASPLSRRRRAVGTLSSIVRPAGRTGLRSAAWAHPASARRASSSITSSSIRRTRPKPKRGDRS